MSASRETTTHKIVVPRLHGNGSYYKIVAWLKEEGDTIHCGDALLILETDKAAIELPAEVSGVLSRIFHAAGEWVEVQSDVGIIE